MAGDGFRQGDVLVVPVAAIPAGARPVEPEGGRLVVARGEATGHHHGFPWKQGAVLFRDDGGSGGSGMYVEVDAPVALEHQEHTAHVLSLGSYEVRIQRVFRAGMVRRVED